MTVRRHRWHRQLPDSLSSLSVGHDSVSLTWADNADQGGSIAANEYAGIARQLNWNNYAGRSSGLAQWAMPYYDEVRPDYDYSDASGAPQFYRLIDIPSGHTAFSLTIPAGASQFAISGIQVVVGP